METTPDRCRLDPLASNRLGEIAITKVILRAIEKGIVVSRPTIECRYDLILDDGLKLERVQVKYAGGSSPKHCQGMVPVGLRKWRNGGRRAILCYTAAEIDAVLVYVRQLDAILRFGPDEFDGRKNLYLRLTPAKNNQVKRCLMAADYAW